MNWLYDSPLFRAAAPILWIHSVLKSRFRVRRSRYAYRKERFTASFADRYSFPLVRKNPLACFSSFLRRARRFVPRLTRGMALVLLLCFLKVGYAERTQPRAPARNPGLAERDSASLRGVFVGLPSPPVLPGRGSKTSRKFRLAAL